MRGRMFAVMCLAVMFMARNANAAIEFYMPDEKPSPSRHYVVNDPRLKPYDNPTEFDVADGNIHISFKGVFRSEKFKDEIAFVFVAVSSKDFVLDISRGNEAFDGKGTRFNDWISVWIGRENTRKREILDGIPITVEWWLRIPETEAKFPTIARVHFCFNGQWFEFRNMKSQEWSLLSGLLKELGLEMRPGIE